jgi:glyoxylase-like metal-dependent hydrolase (beta-lactamase superfamily II)
MHPADIEVLAELKRSAPGEASAREVAFLCWLGATAAEAAEATGPAEGYARFNRIGVPDRELTDGDLADVPGWRLRAVHTPGHTLGHLCFVDERSRRLFSGDHVLPRITPNISVHRVGRDHQLEDYLGSLAKVRGLDVDEIMPAHEWRFRGLAERADHIAEHHEKRLGELLGAVAANPGSTPWFLAGKLTWSRTWDQYGGRMRISAVTETAAHVFELVRRGLIVGDGGDVPAYRVTDLVVG